MNGFKLLHTELKDTAGPTGTRFPDSVAIGDYNDDTHHLAKSVCTYPAYMDGAGAGGKPYFIPFRALMVRQSTTTTRDPGSDPANLRSTMT